MTPEQTRQLGIEFERRVQTMIPEKEFVDKINGLSYSEIAARGGGILNSADRLHQLSEEALYQQASNRVKEIIRKGTGAVEIKSGYGLNTADEIKMLHVIESRKKCR